MVTFLIILGSILFKGKNIETVTLNGKEYISLKRMAYLFNGDYIWIEERKKAVVKIEGIKYIFTADNSTVVIEEKGVHLPLEVKWNKKDELFLPVSCFDYVFKESTPPKPSFIKRLWINTYKEFSLNLVLSQPAGFKINAPSYKNYRILIEAGSTPGKIKPKGDIKSIKISSERKRTVLNIIFKKNYKIKPEQKDTLIKFSFIPIKKAYKKFTVILDPGHGGRDPGAIGPRGTKEKTITLDIAKRVKKYLEREGYRVLLTRTKDKYVSLRTRAEFANKNKGDIFVSIHCNAAPYVKGANGLETYFLAEAKTTWARAVAMRENASLRYDEKEGLKGDIDLILTDLAQNEFLKESSLLAELIQESTAKVTKLRNRGLNQAGFYVLKWCFMPSVLVETAFISNRREENLLRTPAFREKLAKGISQGIIKFLKDYEKKVAKG